MSGSPSLILPDFPSQHRLGGAALFRELLGKPGRSTFARYLQTGLIPQPDTKLGSINKWREETMAAAVRSLMERRTGHAIAGGDRTIGPEGVQ